jgi:hypothetical protein
MNRKPFQQQLLGIIFITAENGWHSKEHYSSTNKPRTVPGTTLAPVPFGIPANASVMDLPRRYDNVVCAKL